jgi:IS1 family transposase
LVALLDRNTFERSMRMQFDVQTDHWQLVVKLYARLKPIIHKALARFVERNNQMYAEAA